MSVDISPYTHVYFYFNVNQTIFYPKLMIKVSTLVKGVTCWMSTHGTEVHSYGTVLCSLHKQGSQCFRSCVYSVFTTSFNIYKKSYKRISLPLCWKVTLKNIVEMLEDTELCVYYGYSMVCVVVAWMLNRYEHECYFKSLKHFVPVWSSISYHETVLSWWEGSIEGGL